MTRNSNLFLGLVMLVIGIIGVMLAPSIHSPMTGMMQAMTNAQFPPGLAAVDLPQPDSQEVELLTKYCTQCHALPGPGMHTEDEWSQVVGRMTQYINTMHTFHLRKPSADEIQAIQGYLQRFSQKAMEKSQYPDLDSPAGIAFLQTCSRCHSTPDPTQHTQDEWPPVIQRMMVNMKIMGKSVPDQQQLDLVTAYLQRHAAKNN